MPSPSSVSANLSAIALLAASGTANPLMLTVVAESSPLDDAHPVKTSTPANPTAAALRDFFMAYLLLMCSTAPSHRRLHYLTRAD